MLLLQPLLLSSNHILPQIPFTLSLLLLFRRSTSIPSSLLVLLRTPLLRIQHPPPLPLIRNLKRRRRNQHRQRQSLRIHTRLHNLLLPRHIRIPPHDRKRPNHTGDPRHTHNLILLAARESHRAVDEAHPLQFALAQILLARLVPLALRIALGFEVAGGAVGGDDSDKGARGGYEEGFHGDGEVADCLVAF